MEFVGDPKACAEKIAAKAPFDLWNRDKRGGVKLYVKRVFIMDDAEALMPVYLRFVKGVVDAQDLSLNVSRELLQQDRQIQLVRRRLVKKVLSTVKGLMADKPESYATFWREFGTAVKEGLLSDPDNRDAILDIASFASTADPEQPTTLARYVERMKDDQQHIYYMTGDSRTTVENSPHLEALRAKGFEVLILTDPIDEMWVDAVPGLSNPDRLTTIGLPAVRALAEISMADAAIGLQRIHGAGGDMRRQHHIVEREERIVRARRLGVERLAVPTQGNAGDSLVRYALAGAAHPRLVGALARDFGGEGIASADRRRRVKELLESATE